MNPLAALAHACSLIVHYLPFVGIPAVLAGFLWKAVQK